MKKKIEASKIIIIFIDTIISISLIMVFFLKYIGLDLSDISPIICAVIGLASVAHGFYYNKAKAENQLKIAKQAKEMGIHINMKGDEEIES